MIVIFVMIMMKLKIVMIVDDNSCKYNDNAANYIIDLGLYSLGGWLTAFARMQRYLGHSLFYKSKMPYVIGQPF